jgi:hypothetical protein
MAHVYVEVDLCDFSDDEIREEYEDRFLKGKAGATPELKNDRGLLVLSFSGLDACRIRDAIDIADQRMLYDLVKRQYELAGRP